MPVTVAIRHRMSVLVYGKTAAGFGKMPQFDSLAGFTPDGWSRFPVGGKTGWFPENDPDLHERTHRRMVQCTCGFEHRGNRSSVAEAMHLHHVDTGHVPTAEERGYVVIELV